MATIGTAAEKPRVFITDSGSVSVSGDAAAGDAKGSLSLTAGSSPQNLQVIKTFSERCPEVAITANRDKAAYVVRLDHEPASPVTPFTRGNKVAVFDKNDDLIYTSSSRLLPNAVKAACAVIIGAHKRH